MAVPLSVKMMPLSRASEPTAVLGASRAGAFLQDGMDAVPELLGDDRLVLAGIGGALVDGLAEIDAVVDELVDEALVDALAALVAHAFGLQRPRQRGGRAERDEALEDHAHGLRPRPR